ncbi:unnamed protein product, partial [Laminaria digitata]
SERASIRRFARATVRPCSPSRSRRRTRPRRPMSARSGCIMGSSWAQRRTWMTSLRRCSRYMEPLMSCFEPVRVGLIGSGWISEQHIAACEASPHTQVVALADYPRDRGGRAGRGEALASKAGIARYFADYHDMLADPEVEMVTVGLPNALHAEVTLAALDAHKHVVVEKPLCLSLADADRIVQRAKEVKRIVGYAEELCFCPKFVRGKEIVDAGGL